MAIKLKNETILGLMAIVVLFIMIWGYTFLKGKNIFEDSNTYYVTYNYVDELTTSSPVLVNGFQVGTVTDVKLNPEDVEALLVTIEVDGEIKIPNTAKAVLVSSGIMGGKSIILDYGNEDMGNDILPNKSYIEGGTRGLLNSMVDAREVDVYFDKLKSSIGGIIDTISQGASTDESLMLTVSEFQATISNLASISSKLNTMIARSSDSFDETLNNIAEVSNTLKSSNTKIAAIIDNLEVVSEDLREAEINKTVGAAEDAIAEVKSSLTTIKGTVSNAENAISNINGLIENIENGNGSLSSLINDDDLYNNLESTSKNLDLLLQDLRLNPKRYVNVSVFGKKQKDYEIPENDPANKVNQKN